MRGGEEGKSGKFRSSPEQELLGKNGEVGEFGGSEMGGGNRERGSGREMDRGRKDGAAILSLRRHCEGDRRCEVAAAALRRGSAA